MTIKSMLELLAQADATLPDNTTQEISAGDVRQIIKDFVDSVTPGYGAIQVTTPVVLNLTTTPQVIAPFDAIVTATPGFFTANLSAGSVTRALGGVAGSTLLFAVSGFLSGPNNADTIIRLFKNGAPTSFVVGASSSGAANTTAFNLAAFDYTDVDATYDLRASVPAGTATITFDEIVLIAQTNPVRSFV